MKTNLDKSDVSSLYELENFLHCDFNKYKPIDFNKIFPFIHFNKKPNTKVTIEDLKFAYTMAKLTEPSIDSFEEFIKNLKK